MKFNNTLLKFINIFFFSSLMFIMAHSAKASSFKTERWQTNNGAQVVFYQAMEVPMLDVSLTFAAGSAYDGPQHGLSALTTNLINQGSSGITANQLAERLADTGAQYSAQSTRDMAVLHLKTLTSPAAMKQAADTFAAIINQPSFPNEAFEREKNQQLLAIAQAQESPEEIANLIVFKKLYAGHPYAHPINGTRETVSALKTDDIKYFYQRYFVGSNAIVVIVGAISSEQAHQLAQQLTGNLPKGQSAPVIPKAPQLKTSERINVDFPSTQTVLRLAQIGIDHHDPDYFPLTVGNYILGGGALVSKLSHEVREKRGLTYDISSQFIPMPGNGPFLVSLSTQNKEVITALKVTQDTLNNFVTQGPNEAELLAAKQYLMGSFPLSLASNVNIANMLLRMAFYHLPDDYLDTYLARINAVTTAEIKRALQKQINLDQMLYVSIGRM